MAVRSLGPGTLWGVRTDIANSTPVQFGTMQDVSIDISATNKELYGRGQFAEAIGRGQTKITGKVKMGRIQGAVFASLFFGASMATGGNLTANNEAATVAATTPFTVTVANGATFQQDLGVLYASTGNALTLVTTAPTVGQYTVNTTTGLYTFNTGDAGAAVLISYLYGQGAANGQVITIGQVNQGIQPVFQIVCETTYNGSAGLEKAVITLFACVADKLSLPTKMGDWLIAEFDFTAFCNSAGQVGLITTNKVS